MASRSLYSEVDYDRVLPIEVGKAEGHEPPWRSPFRRDLARLIHSAAFRRLQGKTQLFAGLESDFFRNRLTHSLEVAQVAKTIALKLNYERFAEHHLELDMDLVELSGLAHDLGHPPFGHTGERILDDLMKDAGGFEGNAQTLRILCRLEKKLDAPGKQLAEAAPVWFHEGNDVAAGLNLCARSLAAVLKYDSCIPVNGAKDAALVKGYYFSESAVVDRIRSGLLPPGRALPLRIVECQIMDLADDIAYSTYDLEDAFKGGLLNPLDLLFPDDEVIDEVAQRVSRELACDFGPVEVREVLRDLFSTFGKPSQEPDAEWQDWYLSQLGRSYRTAKSYAASGFLRTSLTSSLVNRFVHAVDVAVDTEAPDFGQKYEQANDEQKQRVICDFIAGMTDRYAIEFYARPSSDDFHTMFKP